MASEKYKINVSDLQLGMCVVLLDRPWEQTPFPIHGFYIRDPNELKQLAIHCDYVFIDTLKGVAPDSDTLSQAASGPVTYRKKLSPIISKPTTYQAIHPLAEEIKSAQVVYRQLLEEVDLMMNQVINQCFKSITRLKSVSKELVNSIVGHPDALIWHCRMRQNSHHPYHYLVRSSLWALLLARHLGLPRGELMVLALGMLLRDTGRVQQVKGGVGPASITPASVEKSIAIAKSITGLPPKILHIIAACHEHLDGSGVPQGLEGDHISLLAKVAGIARFYDELSYPHNSHYPISVSTVVSQLQAVRGSVFQNDLVAEFLQAVGLYPTATLVELSSGHVALVVEQNTQWRLLPKVMLLSDSEKKPLKKINIVDLYEQKNRPKKSASLEKWEINQGIDMENFLFDVDHVREQWLQHQIKKPRFSFFKR